MRLLNIILIIFISLTNGIKADSETQILDNLKKGGNIIFIRHAYAPGGGDPENFDINDCLTQRNLNDQGREQSKKIGDFFVENQIPIDTVISSEWCRCKETAFIAFKNFKTKNFLNSFYSIKFEKNKKNQMRNLKKYIDKWNSDKNLVLVTHYVVISEAIEYASSSGEIVISDKNFKKIGNIKIDH
ncbi:histidine phosphatase family protein [Pelagibacterales bacterium SAG-MED39]|nr:histidine phosphatase family protein [Pelagibacterales bacterium SAG-MED39]